jgi:hypothetical protein
MCNPSNCECVNFYYFLKMVQPSVGRIAEKYLGQLGYDPAYIRHPSHGGSVIFKNQIAEYFD